IGKINNDLFTYFDELIDKKFELSTLTSLKTTISDSKILPIELKEILIRKINKRIEQKKEYNTIEQKILNEKNIDKLNSMEDDIINAKHLIDTQKQDLFNKRDNQIKELKKDKEFERLKQEILDTNLIKRYNDLVERISNEKDIIKLEDKNLYDIEIGNINESLLEGENTRERLHIIRRNRLDSLLNNEENETYDTIKLRISELESIPKQPKRPLPIEDEEDIPTRNIDKASESRNLIGDSVRQINYIISEYKKTLSDDDKRFFNRVKTSNVRQMIKVAYEKSLDKRSLLNVFYNIWVLSKDDRFLLSKGFTKKKIQEGKKLSEDINDYLYANTKRLRNMELPRLKKKSGFNMETRPRIYLKSTQSFLMNPLGFPEEKIDNIKNVQVIIDQYKKSLSNPFDILEKDINTLQDTLTEYMLNYNSEDEKKKYLDKITRILLKGEIKPEDDDIIDIFNSFDFIY
ncbi:11023_t:CDS:2, partial [Scutellospora calospora]